MRYCMTAAVSERGYSFAQEAARNQADAEFLQSWCRDLDRCSLGNIGARRARLLCSCQRNKSYKQNRAENDQPS